MNQHLPKMHACTSQKAQPAFPNTEEEGVLTPHGNCRLLSSPNMLYDAPHVVSLAVVHGVNEQVVSHSNSVSDLASTRPQQGNTSAHTKCAEDVPLMCANKFCSNAQTDMAAERQWQNTAQYRANCVSHAHGGHCYWSRLRTRGG